MSYLNKNIHKIHFIGIGGVSMSALAEIMKQRGYEVSGSDIRESKITQHLKSQNIDTIIGHKRQNVNGKDLIIYTGAVKSDNVELIEAKKLGIPAVERAPFLGEIIKGYNCPIAISGTHGKTTTTSVLAEIFLEGKKNPTVLVGGCLPGSNSNYVIGSKDYIIFEACEYLNSFLNFPSKIAIVLNIEKDHLDFFSGIEEIKESFTKFVNLTGSDGIAIFNGDDQNCLDVAKNYIGKSIFISTKNKDCDYYAEIKNKVGFPVFDVYEFGKYLGEIKLIIPGNHNVYNALCAIAAARHAGIAHDIIACSLQNFKGAGRRFEYVGVKKGITVVDDYAHHPSEIKATLTAAANLKFDKIICIFQPHTYTRTKALLDDFAKSLSLCDTCILVDIYAAREKNTCGISSKDLAEKITNGIYAESFEKAVELATQNATPNTLILTMGAGDVYKMGPMILNKIE